MNDADYLEAIRAELGQYFNSQRPQTVKQLLGVG